MQRGDHRHQSRASLPLERETDVLPDVVGSG
jgi:hypothetical protein